MPCYIIPCHTTLYYTTSNPTKPHSTMLFHTNYTILHILYFTMPCYTKLYNTILYHSKTIMRNTVYDTILYHTLLSYPIIFYMIYHNTRVCSGFMSVSLNPKTLNRVPRHLFCEGELIVTQGKRRDEGML